MSLFSFIKKVISKPFTVCPACDTSKEKFQSETYSRWTLEIRSSHPCPICFSKPCWFGKVCNECQDRLNIWCPCAKIPSYTDKGRLPVPNCMAPEGCLRCGLRIKELWECEDDDKFDMLFETKFAPCDLLDKDKRPCKYVIGHDFPCLGYR